MGGCCHFFCCLAHLAPAAVEAWPPQPPAGVNDLFRLTSEGKNLAAVALCEKLAADSPMLGQELATLRSSVGDWQGALQAIDKAMGAAPSAEPEDANRFADSLPKPAVDRLLELARDRRVVIVNEAHHVAAHRAFTHQLLQGLWDQGYRYFAAETFKPPTKRLSERGYPTRNAGYYTHEPVFGDLVRTALKTGFKPVACETLNIFVQGDSIGRINAREADQCANLVQRIFEQDPEAKVLIHVGYSHATEDTQ